MRVCAVSSQLLLLFLPLCPVAVLEDFKLGEIIDFFKNWKQSEYSLIDVSVHSCVSVFSLEYGLQLTDGFKRCKRSFTFSCSSPPYSSSQSMLCSDHYSYCQLLTVSCSDCHRYYNHWLHNCSQSTAWLMRVFRLLSIRFPPFVGPFCFLLRLMKRIFSPGLCSSSSCLIILLMFLLSPHRYAYYLFRESSCLEQCLWMAIFNNDCTPLCVFTTLLNSKDVWPVPNIWKTLSDR